MKRKQTKEAAPTTAGQTDRLIQQAAETTAPKASKPKKKTKAAAPLTPAQVGIGEDSSVFEHRLARHYDELKWLYCELYHGDLGAFDSLSRCSAGAGRTARRTCGCRTPNGKPTPTGTAAGSCWA